MANRSYLQRNAKYYLSDRRHYFYLRYDKENNEQRVLLCIRKGKEETIVYNEPSNHRNRFALIDEFEKRLGIEPKTEGQKR